MVEQYRVLASCPSVWDGLGDFQDTFIRHGIVVDIPEIAGQQLNEDELLAIIDRYDGVLAGDDHLTRRVIEAGSRLKVISKWGVGVDAIDLEAARDCGVIVSNTPGMFGDELADYALGFLLLIARQQHIVDRGVREGEWPSVRGHSLAGRTLGIVGLGSSGSALAERAIALRLSVMGADPLVARETVRPDIRLVEMGGLLNEADVISLHLPAQPEGSPLVDSAAIDRAKPGFWLINVSRGSLVDEEALMRGLNSGQVGAAALDVYQREPVQPDHPLLRHPRVILGSHNGSNTHEAVERTTRAAVINLVAGLTGESVIEQ